MSRMLNGRRRLSRGTRADARHPSILELKGVWAWKNDLQKLSEQLSTRKRSGGIRDVVSYSMIVLLNGGVRHCCDST